MIFKWIDPVTGHGEYWNARSAEELRAHLSDEISSVWTLEIKEIPEDAAKALVIPATSSLEGADRSLWHLSQREKYLAYIADIC